MDMLFKVDPGKPSDLTATQLDQLRNSVGDPPRFKSLLKNICGYGRWKLYSNYGYTNKQFVMNTIFFSLPSDTGKASEIIRAIVDLDVPNLDITELFNKICDIRTDMAALMKLVTSDIPTLEKLTVGCVYYKPVTESYGIISKWSIDRWTKMLNSVTSKLVHKDAAVIVLASVFKLMQEGWTGYETYGIKRGPWYYGSVASLVMEHFRMRSVYPVLKVLHDAYILGNEMSKTPVFTDDQISNFKDYFKFVVGREPEAFGNTGLTKLNPGHENIYYALLHFGEILKSLTPTELKENEWIYLYAVNSRETGNHEYKYVRIANKYSNLFK